MGKRILYVEDDADDKELLLIHFRGVSFPHELLWARDGSEALQLLDAAAAGRGPAPDLLLTDLKMPRMNGIELLERLRVVERWRSLPVVFLTSSSDERDRQRALALGASLFLRKPERFEEYAQVAERLRTLLE